MKIFTWKQRIVVLSVTITVIAVFAVIGYFIGQALGNWKLGISLGALVSYPFTQFALLRSMKRLYKVENPEIDTTK